MRKKLLLLTIAVLALGALTAAGFASAAGEGPVTVTVGNIKVVANGSFSPKALSKTKPTPITLSAEGKISTLDGTHPPAIEEVLLETDKNGSVNVKGLPTCRLGQLQSTDTAAAEKACGTAKIGEGKTTVEVQFPEQNPINVNSKLLVFNGGESGGKTTLYIHAYFNAPITGAIVTTVKISKIHKGRFGLLADATIPKIAGGSGSVTSFSLKLNKGIKYKAKPTTRSAPNAPTANSSSTQSAILRRHPDPGRNRQGLHAQGLALSTSSRERDTDREKGGRSAALPLLVRPANSPIERVFDRDPPTRVGGPSKSVTAV